MLELNESVTSFFNLGAPPMFLVSREKCLLISLAKSDVSHSLFEIVVDDYGTGSKGVSVFP